MVTTSWLSEGIHTQFTSTSSKNGVLSIQCGILHKSIKLQIVTSCTLIFYRHTTTAALLLPGPGPTLLTGFTLESNMQLCTYHGLLGQQHSLLSWLPFQPQFSLLNSLPLQCPLLCCTHVPETERKRMHRLAKNAVFGGLCQEKPTTNSFRPKSNYFYFYFFTMLLTF